MISQGRSFFTKPGVRTKNAREPDYVVFVDAIICASVFLLPWLPAQFQMKSVYVALFALGLKHPVTLCAVKGNTMKMFDIPFWFLCHHSDREQALWEDVCS